MKKLFLLASFAAAIFVLSNLSFAADEVAVPQTDVAVVVEAQEPCSCCYCAATAHPMPAPMPFAYPPAPQRVFGAKIQALLGSCPLLNRAPAYPCDPYLCDPCVAPAVAPVPCDPCVAPAPLACDPCVAPYPALRPHRAAFAARRAARFAAPPFPCPPAPAVMPAPPVVAPPVGVVPAAPAPGFAAAVDQVGRVNYMSQRAPIINLLSVVRAPRPAYPYYADPNAAGFYQVPVTQPAPAFAPAMPH